VCEQRAKAAGPLARKSIPASGPLCKKRKQVCPKCFQCVGQQKLLHNDGAISLQNLHDIARTRCIVVGNAAQLDHRGPLLLKT
jgi:hypothetical protein